MPEYTTPDIRNIALVGHGGAGKTTLAEALLHKSGEIPVMGDLARGTTVMDFDAQERAHQISLNSAVASFSHQQKHVNLVDTPGYPDFLGRALSVLPAVETAAVVVDAKSGLQTVTRRMMEISEARGLCRLLIMGLRGFVWVNSAGETV